MARHRDQGATVISPYRDRGLPFSNLTVIRSRSFCDGMAEELIGALSRVKGLAVAATYFRVPVQGTPDRHPRNRPAARRAERARGQGPEGRQQAANHRTVINVADGYHIWSERYDRTIDDVFAIQDEIARAITESLRVTLARQATGTIVKPPPGNIDAYHLYLRGRFLLNRFADLRGSLTAARQCFEEAIALDPNFSAAYAGLSEACNALGYTTSFRHPGRAAPRSMQPRVRWHWTPRFPKLTRRLAGPRHCLPSTWHGGTGFPARAGAVARLCARPRVLRVVVVRLRSFR